MSPPPSHGPVAPAVGSLLRHRSAAGEREGGLMEGGIYAALSVVCLAVVVAWIRRGVT